jgi:glutamate-ammonia-ligase adenylyltransferase
MPLRPLDENAIPAAVERARRLSHYARHVLDGEPGLAGAPFAEPFGAGQMRAALAGLEDADEAALDRALRRLRRAVMLRLIVRDLAGWAGMAEVVAGATALAEETVAAALRWHDRSLQKTYGAPIGETSGQPLQLHVVGMGKLGGAELNVSSDIDLVLAYPEEGETDGGRRISAQEYFTRLSRKLIGAIAETTEDGFVFRVDTRLRPYGEGGPLVVNFDMLEAYFATQGREWERYAWVKARLLAGDRGKELEAAVTPFVYRRHLDFSAIESLRGLHGQIRQEVQRREMADNVKLGPGGIREVEFLVQVFQLIRGGRETALRVRPTLAALQLLGERGQLPAEAVAELRAAYVYLRDLEHRLQYRDDQQTQSLPAAPDELQAIAEMTGQPDAAGLRRELDAHREVVTRHFEAIFAGARDNGAGRPEAEHWPQGLGGDKALARIAALGYADAPAVQARLAELRDNGRYRRMAASGQARLDQLLPRLIEAAAGLPQPDLAFERTLRVVDSIGRRESYLALLLEYPQALGALARLAAASPWAADYLAQHPILLDELISPVRARVADWAELRRQLQASLDEHAGNTERQMDVLRHFKQAQTLRLLALDLSGELPLETLSDHLSDLACVILEETLRLAWLGVRQKHREVPRFAVIGYGKLGGKELGYASDLDIIFLYEDPDEAAPEAYARLAQRINTWLTSATGAGVLYETDLRLRPNGVAGLLVSHLEAFREYEFGQAWIWEHQALTRARAVAGDRGIGESFERIRVEVLRQPRDLADLRREIRGMREKMREGHPNPGPLFDLKHDRGGIVDVEFVVQFLVLGHAHRHAELTGNIGNLALLKLSARLDLIPAALADAAHAAYREFRGLQHQLRLQGERYARVERPRVEAHARAVMDLWDRVLGETD